ncbi:hypothetical protein G9A89_007593 [Geosiphon pyriformis]|nr:hypothetical protein G9A89_007593 [Geosiphon pyriformis]
MSFNSSNKPPPVIVDLTLDDENDVVIEVADQATKLFNPSSHGRSLDSLTFYYNGDENSAHSNCDWRSNAGTNLSTVDSIYPNKRRAKRFTPFDLDLDGSVEDIMSLSELEEFRQNREAFTEPKARKSLRLDRHSNEKIHSVNSKKAPNINKRGRAEMNKDDIDSDQRGRFLDHRKSPNHSSSTRKRHHHTTATPRVYLINEVDDDIAPKFIYSDVYNFKKGVSKPNLEALAGCDCRVGECGKDGKQCLCLEDNDYQSYYSSERTLRKSNLSGMIRECNIRCKCGPNCLNRVVQNGRFFELEIFKTINKGWGVRTINNIPADTFIDIYAGAVINQIQAGKVDKHNARIGTSYLFNIDLIENEFLYTVDATNEGNVARFFNHSCDPNMVAKGVVSNNPDIRVHDIAFFTRHAVNSGEELTFDYFGLRSKEEMKKCEQQRASEVSNLVYIEDPVKLHKKCLCESRSCRGFVDI